VATLQSLPADAEALEGDAGQVGGFLLHAGVVLRPRERHGPTPVPLPSIAMVAQPELRLAGLRLNPRGYSPSRASFSSDLWLMEVGTGKTLRIDGLPSPLSVAAVAWSPDQKNLALSRIDPYT
jgi:hypothetical protein